MTIEQSRVTMRETIERLAEERRRLQDRNAIIDKVEAAIAKTELGQALEANIQERLRCWEKIDMLEAQLRKAAWVEHQTTGNSGLLCEGACYIRTNWDMGYHAEVVADLSVVVKSWRHG